MAEDDITHVPTAADEESTSAGAEDSFLNEEVGEEAALDQPETAAPEPGNSVGSPSAEKSKDAKPRGGISINGTKFTDRQSAQDYMQQWIAELKDEEVIEGEKAFFLFDLLCKHPNYIEKVGTCTCDSWWQKDV